jgi:outer membrane protein assembly factor BamB
MARRIICILASKSLLNRRCRKRQENGAEQTMNYPSVSVLRSSRMVAAVAALALVPSVLVGLGVAAGQPKAASATPTNYTWTKYAYSNSDTGVSPDPTVSTANASTLGLKWMAADGTSDESSPIVAYDPALGTNVVYQGNEAGSFTAFNAQTGAIIWSDNLGSAITSTPLFFGGSVYVIRSFSPALFKLNGATGATQCRSAPLLSINYSTPTVGTPPGQPTTIFVGENGISPEAPVYGLNAQTCAKQWTFTNYNSAGAGSWDPYSYVPNAGGHPLLVFGSDNPDDTVYAVNPVTGAKVWSHFVGEIGTGASVTPPGVNGFADGALYISSNGGTTIALDPVNGKAYWSFDYESYLGAIPGRGTAAVAGNSVIIPGPTGVLALNAKTGAVLWNWTDNVQGSHTESDSAAAVVGPPGQQVVAVTDLAGQFDVLDAQTGTPLFQAQTGGFDVTSVAESNGNFYVASGSGFLYDFGLGGTSGAAPTTSVTAPATGSHVANPNGNLAVTGTASGTAISAVNVAVQSGGPNGPWWDAATGTWNPGFFDNPATLGNPGAASTAWTLQVPILSQGGTFTVQASAVDSTGAADISGFQNAPVSSNSSFVVGPSSSAPMLATPNGAQVAPGATIAVNGSGFASGEAVSIALSGATLATPSANGSGSFSTAVPVPATAAFGVSALIATGQTSGRSSSAPIDVLNDWSSAGNGSLHQSNEPNDQTWNVHIVGNPDRFITQAWSYPSGAAIRTAPAVVGDVAYTANVTGTVTALNVRNSQPIWTTSLGQGLYSSPAVGGNLVVLGTQAHFVKALSTTSGAVAWSTPTSSAVTSAPTIVGSTVYVGSNDGTVYALNLSTGAVRWQVKMGGGVMSSPSVDPATGEVVVTDLSGAVTALDAATGSQKWVHAGAGPISATPMIDNGNIYVGSQDGFAYALNETTGAQVWSYNTTAPITVGGAFWSNGPNSNYFVVGNNNGQIDWLQLQTGTFLRQWSEPAQVTGVSAAAGWVTVSFNNGLVIGNKFPLEVTWNFQDTGIMEPVSLVNGVAYVGGQDGALRAFTVPATPIP